MGGGVSHLQKGDRVSVEGVYYCGECFFCQKSQTHLCIHYDELGFTLPGGYSNYTVVRSEKAHKFSSEVSFEVAALTEPAAVAGMYRSCSYKSNCIIPGHAVKRANIQSDETVVVIGPGV